jgi:hypothetical protein
MLVHHSTQTLGINEHLYWFRPSDCAASEANFEEDSQMGVGIVSSADLVRVGGDLRSASTCQALPKVYPACLYSPLF